MGGVFKFRWAVTAIFLLVLSGCDEKVRGEPTAEQKAMVAATAQRLDTAHDVFFGQCGRVMDGKRLDRAAFRKVGFKAPDNNSGFTINLGNTITNRGYIFPLSFSGAILDKEGLARVVAEKPKHRGESVQCFTRDASAPEAIKVFRKNGYSIRLIDRGKFQLRKGSTLALMRNTLVTGGARWERRSLSIMKCHTQDCGI